jgi:hypothetical protein
MKKVLVLTACMLALGVFSFFKNPQSGPHKIGPNLYRVASITSLKPADQLKLKAIIARQYNIKSFNAVTTVNYQPIKGTQRAGNAIAVEKLSSAAFQQTVIEDGEPEEVTQRNIYSLTNMPAIGDVTQVLTTYNAQ